MFLGVSVMLAMENRRPEWTGLPLAVDDPTPSIEVLRQEIQRLRAQLASKEAGTGSVRLERRRADQHVASDTIPRDESVCAAPNGESRMPELLAELRELVASGALEARYKDPDALVHFLVSTWLEAGAPDRAVALMSRFEMDGSLAGYAVTAVDQLLQKGDHSAALYGCLLLARSGHERHNVVLAAMTLGAARVLEELDATAVAHGKKWDQEDWSAQRSVLLLSAGETKAAIEIVGDILEGDADLPAWMWPQFVEKAPKESESLLRAGLRKAKNKETRHELQKHLALALKRQGRKSEAVQIMRELIDAEISDDVVSAFHEVDRSALVDWLARRVRTKPTARSWGLYGDSLLTAKRTRHAISAWWAAARLDASCEASRKLIEHVPQQAIMCLTRPAQDLRDDELIGDIADALWRLGKRHRARDLWQQALQFDSDDSEWTAKLMKVEKGLDPMR